MHSSRSTSLRLLASWVFSGGVWLVAAQSNPSSKVAPAVVLLPPIFATPAPTKTALSERARRPAKSAVRTEISSVIRQSFSFAPPALPEKSAASAPAPDGEVVAMKPFHVVGGLDLKGLDLAIADKELKIKEEAFNLKDGGTIMNIGPAKLKLKYSPEHKGWDILKLRW